MNDHKPKVAIAGATGFIGSRLCEILSQDFQVIALTRRDRVSNNNVIWRKCDLYSLESCITALEGIDSAVYLVHSMMPSARLTQSRFEDLDLILADNFARAAHHNDIQHIVYVGGLDPDTPDTSVHLSSRMEVEQVLSKRIECVTALRSGLVIGPGGSSYEILKDVVRKLPVILCPSWSESYMQPIGLEDLVFLIKQALSDGGPEGCHDVCAPDVMTYRQLMESVADQLSLHRRFLKFPIENTLISSIVVKLLTGKPISLIQPLLQSLNHDMVAKNTQFQNTHLSNPLSFSQAFNNANSQKESTKNSKSRRQKDLKTLKKASAVRSVQRMTTPQGKDAFWLAEEYLRWLPQAFKLLIRADYVKSGISRMYLRGTNLLLLELTFQPHHSSSNRAIYTISDGILVRSNHKNTGTFEFRLMLDSPVLLTAIHNFYPRLPWYIYTVTQAQVHMIVMKRFAQYLSKISI